MLKREDNELLTRVCGEAPMGSYLRDHFWFPAALSQTLVADGRPHRVRLMGRSYVAWRSNDGRLGFFDEHCPHRRVSLTLARNEDNALRCIFHGWKFSVTGETVEIPTEPYKAAELCKRVPLKHHPVREAGGIVWVWLGHSPAPPLPDLEFLSLPAHQVYPEYQTVGCNWVQGVEGGMDAAHVGVLHSGWLAAIGKGSLALAVQNVAPVYEFEERPGGFRYAAIRKLPDGTRYVRVNEFLAPWCCFISAESGAFGDRTALLSVPVDDQTMMFWTVRYNPFKTLSPSAFNPVNDPTHWPPLPEEGAEDYWGQDRMAMKRDSFSGFHHPTTEDFAVWQAQGAVADRSGEFLNAGDQAVVRVRKILIDAARQHARGGESAPAREAISYANIRPMANVLRDAEDWREMAV